MKMYFTFGTDENYPFYGGWVEANGKDREGCIRTFREHYHDRTPGVLNCADYYTAQSFNQTDMPDNGNFGQFCHDILFEDEENKEGLKSYYVPIEWTERGYAKVFAASKDDAMNRLKAKNGNLGKPEDGTFLRGSVTVNETAQVIEA